MQTTDTQAFNLNTTGQLVKGCAIGAGMLGSFLTGILVATSAGGYGVGLTRTGWDLARGGTILCIIVAMLSGLTWWGVEQVVQRLGARADRNRDATLAMAFRLDQLEAALRQLDATPSAFDGEVQQAVTDISRVMRDRR